MRIRSIMMRWAVAPWLRRLSGPVSLGVLAALMVLTAIIPASFWRAPKFDIVANGFDPVTMYTTTELGERGIGAISFTKNQMSITALQGSGELAHLVTSPMSYNARFSFHVTRAEAATVPLTIAITAPYPRNELRLVLGPAPARTVSLEWVVAGLPVRQQILGSYAIGVVYDVDVAVNRANDTARLSITPLQAANPIHAVHLSDNGTPFESRVMAKSAVPVKAGATYLFSTDLLSDVPGKVGLNLEWLNAAGKRLRVDAKWSVSEGAMGVWRGYDTRAQAPQGAVAVRPEVALAGGASASVSNMRLVPEQGTAGDMLSNGDFSAGTTGWRRTSGAEPLEIRQYPTTVNVATASKKTFPELFSALRMALTVSSSADGGLAQVDLNNYQLKVPHQRWMAVRVSDPALTAIIIALGTLGLAALGALMVSGWRSPKGALLRRRARDPVSLRLNGTTVAAAAAVLVYGVASLLLAHSGSLNADIVGARVWTYTSGTFGMDQIYFLPNVASAEAGQWQGQALQEAGFPYGPTMAYVFTGLGWLYAHGIHQPALGQADAAGIDFAVRMTNGLFGLLGALLIGLIIRGFGRSVRTSTLVGCAYLLAPALAFTNSVWGSTQSISMVFLLGAVLFIQRGALTTTWIFLLAAIMTRPQNLIAAAILALVLLRAYPIGRSIRALSKAIIAVFVLLLPFSLLISPTLPVDVIANTVFMHVGSGNDAWTTPISWGAFGPWQLVVSGVQGVWGTEATLFPAMTPLAGGLSFYLWGALGFLASMSFLAYLALRRGKQMLADGRYLVLATLAVLTLLLVQTGAPSYHMLLPTAMSFLLIKSLSRRAYLFTTLTLSTTTFVSLYGMGAFWLSAHPQWSTGVYDPRFWGAQVFAWSVNNPAIVVICALANTAVMVVLTVNVLRQPRKIPDSQPELPDETALKLGDRPVRTGNAHPNVSKGVSSGVQ
jgi:hypothetical protein